VHLVGHLYIHTFARKNENNQVNTLNRTRLRPSTLFPMCEQQLYYCWIVLNQCIVLCRSQWSRGLRRWFTAACLLRLWVRIPPGAWVSVVNVVWCHVAVSATSRSLVQRSPTDCGVSLCVIPKPREWGGHVPLGAVVPKKKKCRT